MTRIKSIAAATVLSMLMAIVAIAQQQPQTQNAPATPDATATLKKVSDNYRNAKTFHFDGQTAMEMKAENVYFRVEMPFTIASGKAFQSRLQVKGPFSMNKTIVSDGQTVWTYLPSEKQYTKEPVAKPAPGEVANVSPLAEFKEGVLFANMIADDLAEGLKSARIVREEEVEVGGQRINCFVIEAVYSADEQEEPAKSAKAEAPPKPEATIPMTFWVDKDRLLVLRHTFKGGFLTEMFKMFGDDPDFTVTTTLKVAKVNESLPDSLFAFAPPADAREVEKFAKEAVAERGEEEEIPESWIGEDAVDFTLADLNGKKISLESLRGKVVVLDFWASWCGPCRETMPHLEKLHREFGGRGLVVLGVNDEQAEDARLFVKKNGYTFPTLVDEESKLSDEYGIRSIPQTLVIGRDGKITAQFLGTGEENNLRRAVIEALGTQAEKTGEPPLPGSRVALKSRQ